MAGKSCYAKQVALIVFLAHIGCALHHQGTSHSDDTSAMRYHSASPGGPLSWISTAPDEACSVMQLLLSAPQIWSDVSIRE